MIGKVVVVANGKGGTGKSSVVSNVAGLAAAGGWKVLVIDTDAQDHLSLNLGVRDKSDDGAGLYRALVNGEDPYIISQVRPNLDLIPNGEFGERTISDLSHRLASGNQDSVYSFARMVGKLAPHYNLILVDTPPGEKVLQKVVMAAAGQVLVPTRVDAGSREGLDRVCRDILSVESLNPEVVLMGVVGVGLSRASSGMKRQARIQLHEASGGLAPIFESFIHTVDKAVIDGLENGLLAHEYEQAAETYRGEMGKLQYKDRLEMWRSGAIRTYSVAAGGLAEDYQSLTNEILMAFTNNLAARANRRGMTA